MTQALFSVLGWPITTYALLTIICCIAVPVSLLPHFRRKQLLPLIPLYTFIAVLLSLILGRSLYCSVHASNIFYDPMGRFLGLTPLFDLRIGNISVIGVALGCLIAAWITARLMRTSFSALLDTLCFPLTLLFSIMRFIEPLSGQGFGPTVTSPLLTWAPLSIQNGWGGWAISICFLEAVLLLVIAFILKRVQFQRTGNRFLLALLIGAAAAAVFGILIGIPVLRLKGDYLAIVTLAFGEIIKNLVNILFIGKDSSGFHFSTESSMALGMEPGGTVIINGPQGITGTPNDANFTIAAVLLLLTLFIVIRLVQSRDGRAIMAIRDNRIAAESVGINITKYKLMAFTISAALAGVAGVLYAHNLSTLTANTNNFGYNQSIMILVFVVLGGIGNLRGSMIAAVVLTLLPELLRGLADYRMLIIMMIFNWSPKAIQWRERTFAKLKKKTKKEAQ